MEVEDQEGKRQEGDQVEEKELIEREEARKEGKFKGFVEMLFVFLGNIFFFSFLLELYVVP